MPDESMLTPELAFNELNDTAVEFIKTLEARPAVWFDSVKKRFSGIIMLPGKFPVVSTPYWFTESSQALDWLNRLIGLCKAS